LQQVSAAVHKARRACRDLNEVVFPQSEAEKLRLLKLGQTSFQDLANLVQERSSKLSASYLFLEESLESAKEYLLLEHVAKLEQLITAYHDVKAKVSEFFAATAKASSFVDETAALFTKADVLGRATAENLVATRKLLLDAHSA
ncbi:MAG: hypothetical protein M3Z15_10750, partial [Pseudomonadota bacterium]|nr:hypothetical protein [Pseudomonadota bacterium]